jgi:hypothetical protein
MTKEFICTVRGKPCKCGKNGCVAKPLSKKGKKK